MTCRPVDMHPLDALYQACRRYPGGIEALAQRVGIKADTLYKKLRMAVDTHHLGYDGELSDVLMCLQEAQVAGWSDTIHAICWRHGHLAVPVPTLDGHEDAEAFTEGMVRSVKEHAEALAAIGDSLKGGTAAERKVDAREMARIEREVEQAMSALAGLLEDARARHARDFPVATGAAKVRK